MLKEIRILVFALSIALLCEGYEYGAPLDACASMIPVHFNKAAGTPYEPQTTSSPYTVTVNPTSGAKSNITYQPNETFNITIDGGSKEIEGIFIQARRIDTQHDTLQPIGTFDTSTASKTQKRCLSPYGSALTHSEEIKTHQMTLTWTAPATSEGHLQFFVTIVEHFDTFWVKIPSDKILYDPQAGPLPTEPTVMSKTVDIDLSGCGTTKGCFRSPSGCVADQCEYVATYTNDATGNAINFELGTRVPDGWPSSYISIGFSDNKHMGTDSVISCMYYKPENKFMIVNSYNYGTMNIPVSPADAGLSEQQASLQNNRLRCSFKRLKVVTPMNDKIYNLNTKWYLLLARGKASKDGPLLHSLQSGANYPVISEKRINLTATSEGNIFVKPSSKSKKVSDLTVDTSSCGKTKGCFQKPSNCNYTDCEYLVAYKRSGDYIEFEISAKIPADKNIQEPYVSVGFSSDMKMGDDSVINCLLDNNTISVYQSYNDRNQNIAIPNPSLGLKDAQGMFKDGRITCKYSRKITVNTAGRRKRDTGTNRIFDLAKPWHILVARGSQTGGKISMHETGQGKYPAISSTKVNLTEFKVAETDGKAMTMKMLFKKCHACLMICAWVLLAGVGIILARFFKEEYGYCCGEKIWFQVHRLCMLFVMILTVIGFVLIFIAEKGLDIDDKLPEKAHPILGITVTGLCLLNPIMAMFRCHPEDKGRPVFNWMHWFVGIAAHSLSMATIMIGLGLDDFKTPRWIIWVMAGYIIFHVLLTFVLDIHKCRTKSKRSSEKSEAMEMTGADSQQHLAAESKPKRDLFRVSALGVYIVIAGGVTVCLIVLVARG
ncbi:uncharacterized protein LOC141899062 [Tubulanus polymorphus]|uniref:uncharacterized protein LOC141899062 n=1 Tax=Tubulanus polymorphus TaxID=672921 RepID=UPI003DA235EB